MNSGVTSRASYSGWIPCPDAGAGVSYNHMVVELSEPELDLVLRALADATRRDILRRTSRCAVSVSELSAAYDMSFAAVQKHVAALERAGLVHKTPDGRARLVQANPAQIDRARRALAGLVELWHHRIDQLDLVLLDTQE